MHLKVVQELYAYNRWANARVFDRVSTLPAEAFARDLGSSHPSLRDTLTHVVWAEWIWLQRWKGDSPRVVLSGAEFPRAYDLRARWEGLAAEQASFVGSLGEDRLQETVRYVNVQGQTWAYPLWRQMYHVVNHSSYHRGQVTTLLRQLGAPADPLDFLVFHDEMAPAAG